MYRTGILTVSDKGYAGDREDLSGPEIRRHLTEAYQVTEAAMVPDEKDRITEKLISMCAACDVIFTTGGTGMSLRDVTPEATLAAGDRQVPGIAEALRAYSMEITPRAMLGRGVCVMRGRTLIINLPGSRKAVEESMEFLMGNIEHGLDILLGRDGECGR